VRFSRFLSGRCRVKCFPSHPWSHVVIGMWRKYPNSKCTHVVSIDTIDRTVDPVTGIIRTERVLGCKQKTPGWIVKVCLLPSHTVQSFHSSLAFSALWRFRRCFRAGNLFRRPCNTKRNHHIRQSLSLPIRHLLRTNTIFPTLIMQNRICADCRNSGKDGRLAVGLERAREVAGTTV